MNAKSRVYLDYAAATPVDPRVFRAMRLYFSSQFGNPGSLHAFGQAAIAAVDISREIIAKSIGAQFREIIFTASASEANNFVLRGALKRAMQDEERADGAPRVVVSAIEHESVLETARELAREGCEVVYVPVDRRGGIDLKKMEAALSAETVLVSVMYANNEIGSVQPIAEISKLIRAASEASAPRRAPILFHTDAAQAFQFLDCGVQQLGVDFMTLSSHKMYGPKGAGALYVRGNALSHDAYLAPLVSGGGQEFGLRSGTENVPAIVGFAKAAELAASLRKKESARLDRMRDRLWVGIKKIYPKAEINGSALGLPNILNIYFPGFAAQDLLTNFDLNGLAVSSGSACRSRATASSYVIEALHAPTSVPDRARSSIRFSLGRPTTKAEIGKTLAIVKKALKP